MGTCNFSKLLGASEKKDMAILFVIFNPTFSKRIIMNYWYTRKNFENQNLPVFTIELVYEGRKPEIDDAVHVRSNSFMFHKENLYRILETHIPKKYTKLAFLDCDLIFNDPEWYNLTSQKLDSFDAVQPFEYANWLDLSYVNVLMTRLPSAKLDHYNSTYHPGFAWCMKRSFYNEVGFFDFALSGSGDTLSFIAWTKSEWKDNPSVPKALRKKFKEFCNLRKPKIDYVEKVFVNHLFHGGRSNRNYVERHKMLSEDNIDDLVYKNDDGVYEWKNEHKNGLFFSYFSNRKDDEVN